MDLDDPDEKIVSDTLTAIDSAESWQPRDEWVRKQAAHMQSNGPQR
jgi:hypothetical protein